ncbi:MAG TPA: methyltransferase domain-containing protein [Nitrospirota bacterium]|nr:methyltransferase domain-containing protein [Nitrospirota bacterium]
MSKGKEESQDSFYVCPICKQPLTPATNELCCQRDGVEYPVKNGIVDFVTEDLTEGTSPFLRSVDKFGDVARIYEGPSWYGALDMIHAELGLPSIEEMATMMTEIVDAENGAGLDVACGTGFVTRPLAQKMRSVYGIDISIDMLEKATEYAGAKGIRNICFARANVERLPFRDATFDEVTCIGALHLFPDTVEALSEMARVMKRGARLAVNTILKQGLSTMKTIFEWRVGNSSPFGEEALEALRVGEGALHFFDVEELDNYLSQTGFKGFTYDTYGPYILFHAEKG